MTSKTTSRTSDGINVQGTTTGRFKAAEENTSNTPKAKRKKAKVQVDDAPTEWTGQMPEICGMHLGPRTRFTHPYSYDPILQYSSGGKPTGSVYSDYFSRWYGYEVVEAKMKKHFGSKGDYYSGRSKESIEAFLRDLLTNPKLVITRIEEQCNQATGFPVWFFAYKE